MDLHVKVVSAYHASIGSVTVKKTAQMGVTKNIVHLTASYQKAAFYAGTKTNAYRSQRFVMANSTA